MRKLKTVIYVNFAQYDNVGRIFDFLTENFKIVIHFSYDHLRLKNGRPSSYLRVYENGMLIKEIQLFKLRTPELLRFPSLPLIAILMIVQTVWYSAQLKRKYHAIDIYLTLNGFSAWLGNLLRKFRIVKKTIFWVGDYFPTTYPDWKMRLARKVYWKFDKPSMQYADKLVFTNNRLLDFYQKLQIIPKSKKCIVVPIGTKPQVLRTKKEKCIIGFLGMIKGSQGLELIFDTLPELTSLFPDIKIEIIGSGPEEDYYRKRVGKYTKNVFFHGFIEDQDKIHSLVSRWDIGLAPYRPIESNESYWGDPSKIKVYLSVGVPVITTDVSYVADEIRKRKAGTIIDYSKKDFIKAVTQIMKNKRLFSKNAYRMAEKYDYRKLYPKVFTP